MAETPEEAMSSKTGGDISAHMFPADMDTQLPYILITQVKYVRNLEQFKTNASVVNVYNLPFPASFQNSHGVTWSGQDMGAAGALLKGETMEAVKSAGVSLGKGVASVVGEMAADALGIKGSGGALVAGATSAAEVITGRAVNPFTTFMFSGTEFRSFSLSFRLMARNQLEQAQIIALVNSMKRAIYPVDNTKALIEYPNLFEVSVANDPSKAFFKYQRCALRSVNITVNPDGINAFHRDNTPLSYELSLSFQELELLDQTKIDSGDAY